MNSSKSIEKLQQRIENLEWDWKRWPALKKFELQGSTGKRDLLNDLPIDFKKCPTLEIVIFNAVIDIDLLFPNCPHRVAWINKLVFNPQLDFTQFGVEHIRSLEIFKEDGYGRLAKNDEVFKMINENVKGLKELFVPEASYLDKLMCKDALLELHITGRNASSELKITGLKKLKTLEVRQLAHLDNLYGIDALLELSITGIGGRELKEYDLSNIAKRFKNLHKCDIGVTNPVLNPDLITPKEYEQIVEEVFQNSATRVKIVFSNWSSTTYLTKEPFQRCVMKKRVRKLAQLDDLVSMDALLELIVTNVDGHELKDYDLSNIVKLFKNLQKCDIRVSDPNDIIQPEAYAQIVQDVFKNFATKVSIILDKRKMMGCNSSRGINVSDNWHITYLTKKPFQRCVLKKK